MLEIVMSQNEYYEFAILMIAIGALFPLGLFWWKAKAGITLLLCALRNKVLLRGHWLDGVESWDVGKKLDENSFLFVKNNRIVAIDASRKGYHGAFGRIGTVKVLDYFVNDRYPVQADAARYAEIVLKYCRSPERKYLSTVKQDFIIMGLLSCDLDEVLDRVTRIVKDNNDLIVKLFTDNNAQAPLTKEQKRAQTKEIISTAIREFYEEVMIARREIPRLMGGETDGSFNWITLMNSVCNPMKGELIDAIHIELDNIKELDADKGKKLRDTVILYAIAAMATALAFYIINMGVDLKLPI